MHDIKKILNKRNQAIQVGQKKFRGDKLPKVLPKSIIFQNSGATVPRNTVNRPMPTKVKKLVTEVPMSRRKLLARQINLIHVIQIG
jgi:hypothetical protein